MIRIQDRLWINRSHIDCVTIDKSNKIIIYIKDDGWEIDEKYLTDVLTALNMTIGDVLAEFKRGE
jgi:hypothetical protein